MESIGTAMSASNFTLLHPPIVEAVFDVDCDMSPTFDLAVLEKTTREAFGDQYPKFRTQFLQEHQIEQKTGRPLQFSALRRLQAFQCLQEDERQIVQVRMPGFSFTRLTPYSKSNHTRLAQSCRGEAFAMMPRDLCILGWQMLRHRAVTPTSFTARMKTETPHCRCGSVEGRRCLV
jgi:hypothetical protein